MPTRKMIHKKIKRIRRRCINQNNFLNFNLVLRLAFLQYDINGMQGVQKL
uniref:Uncharacterized protein n=1 Tax=Arundo donax TaxID=35708 RepID=A0A0A9GX62_ARUDO